MQKDSEWIAMLSGELEVTRVDVRANEALDLVEVLEVDRLTERPARVRFLDRVEGGRLRRQLGLALDALEVGAVDATRPRYEPMSSGRPDGSRIWIVVDTETHQKVEGAPTWRGLGAQQSAEEHVARLNAAGDPPWEVPPAA